MASQLQLVIVTPEKAIYDKAVRSLRFPLYDGQIGLLPNRAPMVGRLGNGEMTIQTEAGRQDRFFIDGGFVQVVSNVVTILTSRALTQDQIESNQLALDLEELKTQVAHTELEVEAKQHEMDRARKMITFTQS